MAPPPLFDDAVLGLCAASKGDSGRLSPAPPPLLFRGTALVLFAVEGRLPISNGPGAMLFIRVSRLGGPFSSGGPSGSPRPP